MDFVVLVKDYIIKLFTLLKKENNYGKWMINSNLRKAEYV
jgi:hypothetical protein